MSTGTSGQSTQKGTNDRQPACLLILKRQVSSRPRLCAAYNRFLHLGHCSIRTCPYIPAAVAQVTTANHDRSAEDSFGSISELPRVQDPRFELELSTTWSASARAGRLHLLHVYDASTATVLLAVFDDVELLGRLATAGH